MKYEMDELWTRFTGREAILRGLVYAVLAIWVFTTIMDIRSSLWGIEVTAPFDEGRFIEIITSSIPQVLGIAVCVFLGTRIKPSSFKQRLFYLFLLIFGMAMIALDTWLGFLYYRALLNEAYHTMAFFPPPVDPIAKELWLQVMLRAVVRDLLLSEVLIALVAFFIGIAESENVTIIPRPNIGALTEGRGQALANRFRPKDAPVTPSRSAPSTQGNFRPRARSTSVTSSTTTAPATPRAADSLDRGPILNQNGIQTRVPRSPDMGFSFMDGDPDDG